jgi:hypothetical protein
MFSITNETFRSSVRSNDQSGPRLRATQLSTQSTPGVKRSGREAEHACLPGAKDKNDLSYASASPSKSSLRLLSYIQTSEYQLSCTFPRLQCMSHNSGGLLSACKRTCAFQKTRGLSWLYSQIGPCCMEVISLSTYVSEYYMALATDNIVKQHVNKYT